MDKEKKHIHHRLPKEIKAPGVKVLDDNTIIVTEAYCHNRHSLMDEKNKFNGYAGIRIFVEHEGNFHEVVLSPFMNDPSKISPQFPEGIRTIIYCPLCREPLPKIAPCSCSDGASFQAVFLTKSTSHNDSIGICNVHGCHSSFLKDSGNIVSEVKTNIRMEI